MNVLLSMCGEYSVKWKIEFSVKRSFGIFWKIYGTSTSMNERYFANFRQFLSKFIIVCFPLVFLRILV